MFKNISSKYLVIYLISAFVFNKLLSLWLGDWIINLFSTEHSILFAFNVVEIVGKTIEISMVIVFIWLIVRIFTKK